MNGRIGRMWSRRPADSDGSYDESAPTDPAEAGAGTVSGELALSTEAEPDGPEQPVLLTPVGATRQVHVGDVLPPARRGWPGPLARLPVIPKRAILAAGVCAGLAAPAVARHLASRLLLGPSATRAGATLEITRIVYHGPLTAQAIATICKALTEGRR